MDFSGTEGVILSLYYGDQSNSSGPRPRAGVTNGGFLDRTEERLDDADEPADDKVLVADDVVDDEDGNDDALEEAPEFKLEKGLRLTGPGSTPFSACTLLCV